MEIQFIFLLGGIIAAAQEIFEIQNGSLTNTGNLTCVTDTNRFTCSVIHGKQQVVFNYQPSDAQNVSVEIASNVSCSDITTFQFSKPDWDDYPSPIEGMSLHCPLNSSTSQMVTQNICRFQCPAGCPTNSTLVSMFNTRNVPVLLCEVSQSLQNQSLEQPGEFEEANSMCPTEFLYSTRDQTCIRVVNESRSFLEARSYCNSQDGYLWAIESKTKEREIGGLLTDLFGWIDYEIWIDIVRPNANGSWVYGNGGGPTGAYENWDSSEPGSDRNCSILSISRSNCGNTVWQAMDCNQQYPFICEVAPCLTGWTRNNGSCYKYAPAAVRYNKKRDECASYHPKAAMLTIETEEENSFMTYDFIPNTGWIYAGWDCIEKPWIWRWVSNDEVSDSTYREDLCDPVVYKDGIYHGHDSENWQPLPYATCLSRCLTSAERGSFYRCMSFDWYTGNSHCFLQDWIIRDIPAYPDYSLNWNYTELTCHGRVFRWAYMVGATRWATGEYAGIVTTGRTSSWLPNIWDEVTETELRAGICEIATCPQGFVPYKFSCYYFSKDKRNFAHSRRMCLRLSGELVSIQFDEEHQFLQRFLIDHNLTDSVFWTGGHDRLESRNFQWTSTGRVYSNETHAVPLNIALNKRVVFSINRFGNMAPGTVTDGRSLTPTGDVRCAQTALMLHPYVYIELLEATRIKSVKIWKQTNGAYSPYDTDIRIGNSSNKADINDMPLCTHIPGAMPPATLFTCSEVLIGKYVWIYSQKMTNSYVGLCEVKVYRDSDPFYWHDGQPDNSNENCMSMSFADGTLGWQDDSCSMENKYVCERTIRL